MHACCAQAGGVSARPPRSGSCTARSWPHSPLADPPAAAPQAIKRIVNKAGANKGRSFFCCSRQTGPACRSFFKWSDALCRSLFLAPTALSAPVGLAAPREHSVMAF